MGKVEVFAEMTSSLEVERAQNWSAAQESAALEIETLSSSEEAEFRISSRKEILSILQGIAEQGARVCMYYGNGQRFIVTGLIRANESGMWLDVAPFQPENRELLLSEEITFVCMHRQVKIQFVARNIANDLFKNSVALYMKLPEQLLRIQRRESYRSAILSPEQVKCLIPIRSENPDAPVVMHAAPLMDISSGGVRLLCDGDEAALQPNKTFPDCQISLPEVGTLTVTLEVRNSMDFTSSNEVVHKRVGCRFVGLDKHINIPLQRHIAQLQSESMARRRLAEECI